MKILIIDTKISGHHLSYAKCLAEGIQSEVIFAVPSNVEITEFPCRVVNLNCGDVGEGLKWYKRFIDEVKAVADKNEVDIIHFLYGDILLKYFGLHLSALNEYKLIMTFHQFRYSMLRNFSRNVIFKKLNYGVVHTDSLKQRLMKDGVTNAVHIEYPKFNLTKVCQQKEAQKKLGIETDNPVLLALGGTRYDKGLDLLMEALSRVREPFYLLIAGKEESFKRDFIEKACADYKDKAKLLLKFLTDEEFALCLNASDYVVLPYRRSFDGASGPLGEGVALKKPVIGPDHGSIGNMIMKNCIGYTFRTEDVNDLSDKLNLAISGSFQWNEEAEKYRVSLMPQKFVDNYKKLYEEVIACNK